MRWILVLLVLVVGIAAVMPLEQPSEGRVVAIQHDGETVCTAWRHQPHIYITAAHCTRTLDGIPAALTIEQKPAAVIAVDSSHDLAAIYLVPILAGDTLHLSSTPVLTGQSVKALGYGGGSAVPYYTFGRVSNPLMAFPTTPTSVLTGMIIYGGFISGMSGGPIMTESGEVVSVVVGSGPAHGIFHNVGVGVSQETLATFIRYFQ